MSVSDLAQRAWINVTGLALNINSHNSTFDVEPPQYTSTLSKARLTSKLPICTHFLESDTCFKKGKPLPSPNSFVAIQGFLSHVEKLANNFPVRFHINLDHVTFLGWHGLQARVTGTKVPHKCWYCILVIIMLLTVATKCQLPMDLANESWQVVSFQQSNLSPLHHHHHTDSQWLRYRQTQCNMTVNLLDHHRLPRSAHLQDSQKLQWLQMQVMMTTVHWQTELQSVVELNVNISVALYCHVVDFEI